MRTKKKQYYVAKFSEYPDMVNLLTFRSMLGGIGDTFARKLIREKQVTAIYVKPFYWINKKSIIRYVLSEDYGKRRLKVKV